MVNLKTIKVSKNINVNFRKPKNELEEYAITKKQDGNGNERMYTHEEIMNVGLELMENRMSELSKKEQLETRKFIDHWRKILGEV